MLAKTTMTSSTIPRILSLHRLRTASYRKLTCPILNKRAKLTTRAFSAECNLSEGYAINPACICKCGGEQTPLSDPKCAGFAGSLPDPPSGGPGNGP